MHRNTLFLFLQQLVFEPSYMKTTGPSIRLGFGYWYAAKNNLVWFLQGGASFVEGKYDGTVLPSNTIMTAAISPHCH